MEVIKIFYWYLFTDLADPRVYNWPFMTSPLPLLVVILLYLYGIYIILPAYMKNRNPYNLKSILIIYNIFQIILCSTITYGIATSAWNAHYTLGCQLVDYSNDKIALRMASYLWLTSMLRIADMMETFFFILRKKFNQVSFLHVYHHVSSAIIAWILVKYIPGVCGGMTFFCALFNSAVHVIMYTYYLLVAFGPAMQKQLRGVKQNLTLLQIGHMVAVCIHSMLSLLPSCKFPSLFAVVIVLPVAVDLFFFFKFYMKSYTKKKNP